MDQQQDTKLDVKEAAVVPQEHPQWDLSDSDSEHNDQVHSQLRIIKRHGSVKGLSINCISLGLCHYDLFRETIAKGRNKYQAILAIHFDQHQLG